MDESDIVAMVIDDARYAFADGPGLEYCQNTDPGAWPQGAEPFEHSRGTGLKFKTPEDAAKALEALGWSVAPPGVERRVDFTGNGVRVAVAATSAGAASTSTTRASDAHTDPMAVSRYSVVPDGRDECPWPRWFVLDEREYRVVAGPYAEHDEAQDRAANLNGEETDR